jgi:8-oxo-dGTP pyrophosphatase MutT (NUDIX family)
MPTSRIEHAFSAGGVVFRPAAESAAVHGDAYEVVLVGRAADDFWVLPKGTPRAGESPQVAALREVEEESGVTSRIVGELGTIHYWFTSHGTRFSKDVLYYLMQATGGDVSLHDHEHDDARWFPLSAAVNALAFANEAELVRKAQAEIPRVTHAPTE